MGVCKSKTLSQTTMRPKKKTEKSSSETNQEGSASLDRSSSEGNNSQLDRAEYDDSKFQPEELRGRIISDQLLSQNKSSELQDSHRRRLSVSTVKVSDLEKVDSIEQFSVEEAQTAEQKIDTLLPSSQPPPPPVSPVVISNIQKFPDPAVELLNEKSGTVKEVTIDMILALLQECSDTLCLFGSPSAGIQRGFDNKNMDVGGTLAASFNLSENGIGWACKKGLKPESPNQDDFFIIRANDWALYGVFDGHGPFGHDVSAFVHKAIPFLIISDVKFESDPLQVMKKSFRKAHHLLEAASESLDHNLDCTLSGTTGTVVLLRDNKLYIAHVGDSRGVLAQQSGDRIQAVDLTDDHKPTRVEEKKRIEAGGGEVRRLEGDIPHRVFVKNRMYPGLAMSRAIGDTVGVAVGVTPDPDVRTVEVTENDQFVILSTDGVWEFITSQEAVDYVCQKCQKRKSDVQKAAEEEENVVDDVTCLIFWINDRSKENK